MEAKRNELKSLREHNERSYRQALANPSLGVTQRNTGAPHLTLPRGPALRTEERAARSRSASRHDAREGSVGRSDLDVISVPRERQAIERHIGRVDSAHAERHATHAPHEIRHTPASEAGTAVTAGIPTDCDHQQWIQNGATARERAERARAVAQAKRQESEKKEQARLCVFRRETGAGRTTKDQVRPGPNCVFKPHQPCAETTEPPTNASDASETNEEKPTAGSADLSAQHQHMEPSAEASDAPEAVSMVAQGDSDDQVVTEDPSAYDGQTKPSTAPSVALEVGFAAARPEPEHDEKHAPDNEAVSMVAQGDTNDEAYDEQTKPSTAPSVALEFRIAAAHPEPEHDEKLASNNEAISMIAQGDSNDEVVNGDPSAYDGQTKPSTTPSVALEFGIAAVHLEPEHDEKLAPDNEDLCKLGSPMLAGTTRMEQQSDTSEPTTPGDEVFAEAAGKEQQADTSEPTPALDESCPPKRVTATAGPHGPRSRLRQPTKFRDTPSASTTSTAAQGRLRGVPAPSGGAFGSRIPRPCTNSR